jgi:4-methyl-5(b-hydroxyethyl)-thiazole monophosphate biosynthesis
MKKVAIYLADGFEEIEGLTSADVLRRAGCEVRLLSVGSADGKVTAAHGVRIVCDGRAEDASGAWDAVVFPGGMPGALHLRESSVCLAAARDVVARGGIAAAICAAPIVLHAAGCLAGHSYTCYPGFEKEIGGDCTGARVVVDGQLITGCGPGASLEFALTLVEHLVGAAKAAELSKGMLVHGAPAARA